MSVHETNEKKKAHPFLMHLKWKQERNKSREINKKKQQNQKQQQRRAALLIFLHRNYFASHRPGEQMFNVL